MVTMPYLSRSDQGIGAARPLLLAILMALAPAAAFSSSTHVASAAHGGHVYELRVSETPVTWQAALFEARMLGGHLATIGNPDENEVLATLLDSATASGDVCDGTRLLHWVGLSDKNEEGTWEWVNGDHFSFDNWNSGEPNDFGDGEDRVVMVCPNTPELRGKWNDTRDDHPNVYTFFCEYPPRPLFWHQAPLRTGDVFAVALDPQDSEVAYLGAATGVYSSTDGAITWTRTSAGFGDVPVTALAVHPVTPATVFAGTNGKGLFLSTDSGLSWSEANDGLTATAVNEIDIDVKNPSTIYLETDDGVFRSTDGGSIWSLLENAPGTDVATDPHQESVLHTDGVGPLYHWMSTDSGDTWEPVGLSTWIGRKREWAVDPGDSGTLLFTGESWNPDCQAWSQEYVFRIHNNGAPDVGIWNYCGPRFSVIRFGAPGLVYATDPNRLFISTDGGVSFSAPVDWRAGLYTGNQVHDVAADPGRVYLGTASGLMASSDQGSSWDWPRIDLLPSSRVSAIVTGPAGELMFAAANAVIYRSIDAGGNWEPVLAETVKPRDPSLAVDPVNPEIAFAAIPILSTVTGYSYSDLMKSSDGGSNWTLMERFGEVVNIVVDPTTPSTVYVAENVVYFPGVVHKSTDGGSTFFEVSTVTEWVGLRDLQIDPVDTNVLYAVTWSSLATALFKSTDGASSWEAADADLPDGLITAIAIDPVQSQTLYAAVEDGNLHRSDDGAATWTPARNGLPPVDIAALAVDPNDHNQVFAGTEIGVFRSANRGQSWQPTAGDLDTRSLLITTRESGPRIWAGTRDRGLHILTLAFFADDFESGNTTAWSVTVP